MPESASDGTRALAIAQSKRAAWPARAPHSATPQARAGVGILVALPLAVGVLGVGLAVGAGDDLLAGARLGGGDAGERLLVEVVDLDHVVEQAVEFAARLPDEGLVAVGEEIVVHAAGREEVPPGVAMPLRVERRRHRTR